MKRIVAVLISCVMLSGCGATTEKAEPELPDLASPTTAVKGAFGVQLEKKPLRMINIEGELYYETGLVSQIKARCGVMDWKLDEIGEIGEVPQKSGTANFDCAGCQFATEITCEVLFDGEWHIFKKFENQVEEPGNFENLPYCFFIKGRLNNAVTNSELVVLTSDKNIHFSDVFEPMLSSQHLPDAPKRDISFHFVQSGDDWGIRCFPKNITNHSMSFAVEQFGGALTGELQTGEWFQIYRQEGDGWIPVETNPLIDYAFLMVAYSISKNDITEFEVEWEWLYGELPNGYYRLDKKIMDFRASGDFDERIYSVEFTINEG